MADVVLKVMDPAADRKRFLGGSDIAAVMGMGAVYNRGGKRLQSTAYSVWQKKIGEGEEMDEDTKLFLNRRARWEGPIRQMLSEEFEAKIVAFNKRYIDAEHDCFASEIDFEWLDPSDGSTQNGEIKTVHPMAFTSKNQKWGEAGTDEVPIWYYYQAMWGLGITGRRVCILVAMVGLDDMVFYRIERDDELIEDMRSVGWDFWIHNVLAKVAPKPQTLEDVKKLSMRLLGRPCLLDAPTYQQFLRLQQARAEYAVLEEEIESLQFSVGAFICDAWQAPNPYVFAPSGKTERSKKKVKQAAPDNLERAMLVYADEVVATWGKQSGSYLDQKGLKEKHPEIVSEFSKGIQFRVLRPAKQEEK